MIDREDRERIRGDLDSTLLVEAAAGTGKTTELVRRMVAVLASGRARVDRLAAVTFTEKAAGELKLRLRQALEEARSPGPLEEALAHLEEAHISTIHTFCADLLRERPVEAGVDPLFEVLDDTRARELNGQVFDLWLGGRLADPPEGLRRFLRRRLKDGHSSRLRRCAWELAEHRDLRAPWRRPPFDRAEEIARVLRLLEEFEALRRRAARPSDFLYLDTRDVGLLLDRLAREESVRPRDLDAVEGHLAELNRSRNFREPRQGRGGDYGPGTTRAEVLEAHERAARALADFARAADADLAALLQAELLETVDLYEQALRRRGALDFLDLLLKARELVRDSRPAREALQGRYTHLFVDEFQDTDPLQAEIVLLLAADDPARDDWRRVRPVPGKLFLVGDPKQSIYRFRRADVAVYREVRAILLEAGADRLCLSTSFRSLPALQRTVNAAFEVEMTGDPDTLQADYVPLHPARPERVGQPAVIALPVPEPYGLKGGYTGQAIEASLPDATGEFVRWLVQDSGWTVAERPGGPEVPLQARHVCLLFRRFSSWGRDCTRPYVEALQVREIPHLLVGGRSFHRREEIEAVRTALTAVEWPDDELSVYATLRGPLFAFSDADLIRFRAEHGRLHPFRREGEGPVREALDLLADLHRARNRRPPADTLRDLLRATRHHVALVLRPAGEQALANVGRLMERARLAEAVSFRGFVERLREEALSGEASEAPLFEEGSDGVRIMTVHRSKGLEFPVVVLADLTTSGASRTASRTVDAPSGLAAFRLAGLAPQDLLEREARELGVEGAEEVRLAYVAATRARDVLVVPSCGDGPFLRSWLAPLQRVLHPPARSRRQATPAPGCPRFGDDSVARRPAFREHEEGVRPGLHGEVVWWDPHLLLAPRETVPTVRDLELLREGPASPAGAAACEDWRRARAAAVEAGSRPALKLLNTREAEPGEVAVERLPRTGSRPVGPRFGSLVHETLARVDLHAVPREIEAAVTLQARLLEATAAESAAAAEAVAAALAWLAPARRARRVVRESPVSWAPRPGEVLHGILDLAWEDEAGWTVVDFKTDRDLERGLEVYQRQVSAYARALEAATGQPVRSVLLLV